ncbi:hypothetical protein [Anaerocolumna xylanovorans]|uniref:IraD/Gp25-like domain-containing protein n=1 Tax=Anaerocolumna xylanovorans DSM 12503 TaxID=1121345 RepID=A0A1M7YBQ0_9FIRM|nr:hypothetical protein [Anaerocolumna xylanovorans]SHO50062.1 hypothetical protein SAMN02745217_02562 [Anaerocolumna xylanovorans DSM 12503]
MIVIDGVQIEINGTYERNLRQEILDKVSFLLSCVKGTIPMNRDIGLDPDIISAPSFQAQNLYTISAIELIEEFETRVAVEEIEFTESGTSGNMIPKVVLVYNGE